MARTQSTIVRDQIAKENEERVIAENGLAFERIAAIVRLVALVIIDVSLGISKRAGGAQLPPGVGRGPPLAVWLYGAFSLVTLCVLFVVARPDFRKARRAEFFVTVVDFSFMTYMGIHSSQAHDPATAQRGAVIYALLMCFSVGRVSWTHVVLSCLLACAGYMFATHQTGTWQLSTGMFVLSCYLSLAILLLTMHQRIRKMFLELRRRDSLTRFLPPQVAEEVMKFGYASLAPVQREVTVLFSDIRDFTSFSEPLPPGAVLAFLDEYFGHMSQLVKAHDGIVNKFIGDGMLAFWGVPERNPAHAELALKAALDMRKVVEELNAIRTQQGAEPIRIGIGIHTGVVAAGMLGGMDQHEYTVIGDAVNVASRVEGLTKALGVDILVSENTWRMVGHQFRGQRISEQHVKGRQEAVVVYSLEARLPKATGASAA